MLTIKQVAKKLKLTPGRIPPIDPGRQNSCREVWKYVDDSRRRSRTSELAQEIEERRFYVYYLRRSDKEDLFEPGKKCPFYVGKGCNGRLGEHRKEAIGLLHKPGRKSYKIHVIHKLWKLGLDFEEEVIIDNLTEQDAFDLEIGAIEMYGRYDNNTGILSNLTDGGEGNSGWIPHKETRNKIGNIHRGKPLSEEHKKKLRQALVGKSHSEERKEKNRQGHLGKPKSEETKEKLRQAHLGKRHSEETKEKLRKAKSGKNHPMYGKRAPHSQETKQKIRESHLKRLLENGSNIRITHES